MVQDPVIAGGYQAAGKSYLFPDPTEVGLPPSVLEVGPVLEVGLPSWNPNVTCSLVFPGFGFLRGLAHGGTLRVWGQFWAALADRPTLAGFFGSADQVVGKPEMLGMVSGP